MPVGGSLYYYRARYFDSLVGRFISEDPAGLFEEDADLFRYVRNDPVAYQDPNGLQSATGPGFTVTMSDGTANGSYQPPPPSGFYPIQVSTTTIFSQEQTVNVPPFCPVPQGVRTIGRQQYGFPGPTLEQFVHQVECLPPAHCTPAGEEVFDVGENESPL